LRPPATKTSSANAPFVCVSEVVGTTLFL